jgi:hypothetical protein
VHICVLRLWRHPEGVIAKENGNLNVCVIQYMTELLSG